MGTRNEIGFDCIHVLYNTDGRLILTAEVTKNKMAETTKIYFNKVARYFGLQQKPSSRANGENLFKYILLVLAILFFVIYAVRISLPSIFCI